MIRTKFIITIDTEGDNLWSRPRVITTRNAAYLRRFQALCEGYSLKPTYLVNWEMAHDPEFQELGRDIVARQTGEVGMHLHAWDSPPLVPLTADDALYQPYLIEYPEDHMREKIAVITTTLEDTFGIKMASHRAGRWSLDEKYARILVAAGYQVDCSVTPYVSWATTLGDPLGKGGSDFSQFPAAPYFVDLDNIARPGNSPLLELPMTILPGHYPGLLTLVQRRLSNSTVGLRIANRFLPHHRWLRPNGRNRAAMLHILAYARRQRWTYVEFMLHSSELMPGGSPTFPTSKSIEALYEDLNVLFASTKSSFEGQTLSEFYWDGAGDRSSIGRIQ